MPELRPVTRPVADPIVATDGAPVLHDPPGDALLSVVVAPLQSENVPVIGDENEFTVTGVLLKQPADNV